MPSGLWISFFLGTKGWMALWARRMFIIRALIDKLTVFYRCPF